MEAPLMAHRFPCACLLCLLVMRLLWLAGKLDSALPWLLQSQGIELCQLNPVLWLCRAVQTTGTRRLQSCWLGYCGMLPGTLQLPAGQRRCLCPTTAAAAEQDLLACCPWYYCSR